VGAAQQADEGQSATSAKSVYDRAVKAVVTITAQNEDGEDIRFGTGFCIEPNLRLAGELKTLEILARRENQQNQQMAMIVTNFHVIEGAVTATITANDWSVASATHEITVVIEDRHADLAVLVVPASPTITLSISRNNPAIGETVYTIGSALGLSATLTDGIVSGIRRDRSTGVEKVQTTVPISPGSSGGPLLNAEGTVVGVVTSTATEGQNINFGIAPSEINRLQLAKEYKWRDLSTAASLRAAESAALGSLAFVGGQQVDDALRAMRESRWDEAITLLEKAELPHREADAMSEFTWALARARFGSLLDNSTSPLNTDYTPIIELLEHSNRLDPDFLPTLHLLHVIHRLTNNHTQALVWAHSLVQAAPSCAEAYDKRGTCFQLLGNRESAIRDFEEGVRLNPKSGEFYYDLGFAYGKDERAIGALQTAKTLGLSPALVELGMGNHYRLNGKYKDALAAYQRSLDHPKQFGHDVESLATDGIRECLREMQNHGAP